jgi:hypothetical protein
MRGRARKLYLAMGMALVAMLVAAGAVFAAVTFDSSTGKGFVGKGDVQLAFGWNDSQLQKNANGVSFSYNDTATYTATCTWITGEGTRGEQTHYVDIPRHRTVNSVVEHEIRTNPKSKVTGFKLTGFGATTYEGTVPVVGEACVSDDGSGVAQNGTWSYVSDPVFSGGALYASYGGNSILLPITPVV